MEIRSITVFAHPGYPPRKGVFRQAGELANTLRLVYEAADIPVQTTRLATIPFPLLVKNDREARHLAQETEALAEPHGLDYLSLGPALPGNPATYTWIPEMLSATQKVFLSGVMATPEGTIHPAAIRACAEVIHTAAPLEANGFANLRFAALAGVPPHAPFFPAAYAEPRRADPGVLGFALALEAADLAVQAFRRAADIPQAQRNLTAAIEEHAGRLVRLAETVAQKRQATFFGLDFSLAPFPDEATSLGAAMERLGVPQVGLHGSLSAAAILAAAIDAARFPRVGFSGLMLPVLEDATLAHRAAQGTLSVKDLLLYSAVCGTGLDTLPLPGEATVEQLSAVLYDLATLAARLGKPLTARLMPMPGKKPGDAVMFDFPYFANSRVLALEARPLQGALLGRAPFALKARGQARRNA